VIDTTAEPVLALAGLTDRRDGARDDQLRDCFGVSNPAADASLGAASRPPAPVQSETTKDANDVEW
jgi:hypothetical protein